MKTTGIMGALFLLGIGAFGCAATIPPSDLVNARTAYARASAGPTRQYDPANLDTAKSHLDAAEASFKNDGDTQATRDQAYLALRRTELAETIGRTKHADETAKGVVGAMHADQKSTVALTAAELARTKAALDKSGTALQHQGEKLQDEKARREEAEKRAAQLAADLAKFATVKQETRGMVITLNGSVLFASAKSALLPAAQVRLNDVANALIKEDPNSKIVVEGHTDSQGALAYNNDLAQSRAQSVRDYLVSRGIASDRITAQGFGPSRSIADNNSPEGRANNRRVEIVVTPAAAP